MDYIADQAELLIGEGLFADADTLISNALIRAPENDRTAALRRFCTIMAEKAKTGIRDVQGARL